MSEFAAPRETGASGMAASAALPALPYRREEAELSSPSPSGLGALLLCALVIGVFVWWRRRSTLIAPSASSDSALEVTEVKIIPGVGRLLRVRFHDKELLIAATSAGMQCLSEKSNADQGGSP